MPRYIDADALQKRMLNYYTYSWDLCEEIKGFFERTRTADVVDVVRCKDCRYYRKGFNEEEYWSLCTVNPWNYPTTNDENYCSYGERREE